MRKLLTVIFLFACMAGYSQTNYFVKNGGNDGSAGTSDGTAWATITKVNTINFVAGDSIFFNRGDTWLNQTLVIDREGASGDHIYFGAYGTGAKPIFNMKAELTGWDTGGNWTDTGGNIWTITATSNISTRFWVDGTEIQKSQTSTVTALLPWYYASNVFYLYSTSNPATNFSSIERVSGYNIIATINSSDYITLQYLDLRGAYYSLWIQGITDWTIDSCLIGRDAVNGILCDATSSTRTSTDNVIISNNIFESGDTFVDEYSFNNTYEPLSIYAGANNWDIYNNHFGNWGHTAYNLQQSVAGRLYIDMVFRDNTITTENIDYGRGFTIHLLPGAHTGNKIIRNYIYDTGSHNEISGTGDDFEFSYNVIDSVRLTPYWQGGDVRFSSGLTIQALYSDVIGLVIYNNDIINNIGDGISIWYSATYEVSGVLVRNNSLTNNNRYQIRFDYDPGKILSNTFEYNLLFKTGEADVVYNDKMQFSKLMTVTEFNAQNGITTGMYGDVVADVEVSNIGGAPLYVNGTNPTLTSRDYHPDTGSPLIGSGIGVGINNDIDGDENNDPPDIGAYAYNSAPPAPTDLAAVTTSAVSPKATTATSGGNVTDDGGGTVSARGVCWSISINPTILDSSTSNGTGTGAYTSSITGLSGGVTYHVRAYATNESGTAYGADIEFTAKEFEYYIGSDGKPMFGSDGKIMIKF